MDWTDDEAWCGECGTELELVRPGKFNGCTNPACDYTLRGALADLWNETNSLGDRPSSQNRLRRVHREITDWHLAQMKETAV